ncbi:Alanine dehydrogenase 2 [Pontiella desulfatans]|uniref:Alanine dehydrogenase n=1 Tax=Pontiella desulfatans TaxID=2750659 RepID=A0A6C2U9I7_PONDE|nr:alanine dehydrogenase [Pontiella desulfatans]VGO16523.1 Alanine dehydrogenase 2 [Pontiella desulfatans]
MRIGVAKEIKKHEYRVGLTPANAKSYIRAGHEVSIEAGAGANAGFPDQAYLDCGAAIESDTQALFNNSDMIIKVKEPQACEYDLFHEDQILYTYLHLAADEAQTRALMERKIIAVAYETIEEADRHLPCLTPMSEIAGRLSVQEGAKYLEKPYGGRGVLLGGVPGVPRGKVAILGGGIVGSNAAKMAIGLGADVTVLDISAKRLAYLDDIFETRITTLYSNEENIELVLKESDLVIGGVLIPGAKAPHLVRKEHLKLMKPGAVIVDVAVDQGGCVETTHPTTHDDPIFEVEGIVHYCVANMPGAVALTSTLALTSATLPYGLALANQGAEEAVKSSAAISKGLNIYKGACTYAPVAKALGIDYTSVDELIH